MKNAIIALLVCFSLLSTVGSSVGASLVGTSGAVLQVFEKAKSEDLSFLQSKEEITSFVAKGLRVAVKGSRYLEIDDDVSYPYGLSTTKLLLTRLSAQYFGACKEKLVVTSLMRPVDEQPGNASDYSVHPTGMALDLRIPTTTSCRSWLEDTLLTLERRAVLDATRERNPPHYHVAVYPKEYAAYVQSRKKDEVPEKSWRTWVQLGFVLVGLMSLGLFLWRNRSRLLVLPLTVRKSFRFLLAASTWTFVALVASGVLLFTFYSMHQPNKGWEEDASELTALATALYWEGAIAESTGGLHAIAWTIFNRKSSRDYPSSIREVVTQGMKPGKRDGCQFSFGCDGEVELPYRLCELHPNDTKQLGWMGCDARYLNYLVLAAWWMTVGGWFDPTDGAVLYYTGKTPYWITDCVDGSIRKIGSHTFCRSKWNN